MKMIGAGVSRFDFAIAQIQYPTAMPLLSNFEIGLFSYLKALLANLLGKERGLQNENACKLLYFASLGILAAFSTYQLIFRFFLHFKLVLQYYF